MRSLFALVIVAMLFATSPALASKHHTFTTSAPANVDIPIYEAPERVPLDLEQSERLREAAEGHRLYAAILLPLPSGVRPGEVFGLLWN